MFRLRNHNAPMPPRYEHVERKPGTVKEKGWDKVGDFVLRDKIDYMPQEGLQENLCRCESNLIFICGQATSGKAQPYDAKVLTPDGFVEMGSLKVGDIISGRDGKPQRVLQIFEKGERDVYQLAFEDGASTECCDEHLWTVRVKSSHNPYTKPKVLEFAEIKRLFDLGKKIAIPVCNAQEFNREDNLPINPYILGLLLGNGHLRKYMTLFSSMEPELLNAFRAIGANLRKRHGNGCDYQVSGAGITSAIRHLGLAGKLAYDKFIPESYKYASPEVRLNVIQGLFDTDGYVDKQGHIEYSTASIILAKDIQFVIRSLGGRCSIRENEPHFTYKGEKKTGHTAYILHINTGHNRDLFRLTRKRERLFDGFRHGKAEFQSRLIGYTYSGKKQCRCILVSNEDSLYITDDFIVTHNTFSMMLKGLNGLGMQDYTGRFINVRKLDSGKGTSMHRDGVTVWGNFSDCEVTTGELPTFAWPRWNNSIQMIHANFNVENPQEWDEFQEYIKKQQASYFAIDEATAMEQFKMFAYIFSRNRDSSGVTPSMVLSFNPKHGHWTTDFLVTAGYINTVTWYLKPEMDGVTRFFYIKGDDATEVVWGDTKAEVVQAAHIRISDEDRAAGLREEDMVKSFTLFTGTASGNRKLIAATKGQSVANLHNVGGTQRAVLAEAYFGPTEEEGVRVSDSDIRALTTNPQNNDENTYATMDISGGKLDSDDNLLLIWKGLCWVGVETFRGTTSELVNWLDATLAKWQVPKANFAFDSTGLGYYLTGFSDGVPITANKAALQEYDEHGNAVTFEQYFNIRSQLLGKTEALFKTGAFSTTLDLNMKIPYGKKGGTRRLIDILYQEKDVFRRLMRNKRIYYRSKEEYKAKFKESPGLMDPFCLRSYFELDARPKKQPEREVDDSAYDGLFNTFAPGGGAGSVIWV